MGVSRRCVNSPQALKRLRENEFLPLGTAQSERSDSREGRLMKRQSLQVLGFAVGLSVLAVTAAETTRVREERTRGSRRADAVQDGPMVQDRSPGAETLSYRARHVRTELALSGVERAEALLAAAAKARASEAERFLRRLVALNLPDEPGADKVLSEAYLRLADLHRQASHKQVRLLALALQYTPNPREQDVLIRRIEDLGGEPNFLTLGKPLTRPPNQRTPGTADLCTPAIRGALPFSTVMTIEPGGDHDWYVFEIDEPTGGARLRIETISDDPGGLSDDTDLTLCDEVCTGAAVGECDGLELAFNDDSALANAPLMSRIDTGCLVNGTYYLAVGGFVDTDGADNFTLEIDLASCTPPATDDFEPDDDRSDATRIGKTTSADPHTPIDPDRVRAEIQSHSIFPRQDEDWVKFKLRRSELVRIETACDFPTIFNDFTVDCDPSPDTVVRLFYATPPSYGGLCFDGLGLGPACVVAGDCPDVFEPDPFPICVPWELIGPLGPFTESPDQPLAIDDDGGAGLASRIDVCLPLTVPRAASPSASVRSDTFPGEFHWYVQVTPSTPVAVFDYRIQVRNVAPCCFELEPNGGFDGATPMCLGASVHGIFEYSENVPLQDIDLYGFDVEDDTRVVFESSGPDPLFTDTAFRLFVGPDNNGNFFFTGVSDDDGGPGLLSRLEVIVPPAAEFLGVVPPAGCLNRLAACTAGDDDDDVPCLAELPAGDDDDDAGRPLCPAYYLGVTSLYLHPNFPYELRSSIHPPPILETEPNDSCATNAEVAAVGDTFASAIDPACDYDTYKISLAAASHVSVSTTGETIDTVVELRDCSDDSRITCDDDGGTGLLSTFSGCLAAGDYCVRIRAWSGNATFSYRLEIGGGTTCTPGVDPPPTGDGLFKCDDIPPGEFDRCP
jgi:hypothetical protein